MPAKHSFQAGAAEVDISPIDSQFLAGYPHVERMSTGIHDPLLSAALYLDDGRTRMLMIGNDILHVPKPVCRQARQRIADATNIPAEHILIGATHTHSGPNVGRAELHHDPAIPPHDPTYLQHLEDGIVNAATQAAANPRPAELGLVRADATGIGTNRHDPAGPSLLEVPVLAVRDIADQSMIALLTVCTMHPTVLHEDSKLVSADFPGYARQYLQQHVVTPACPVIHQIGPAGNQSPRHVTKGNTFDEAERLGLILAHAIEAALPQLRYERDITLACDREYIDLPVRQFPPVPEAEAQLQQAIDQLQRLRRDGAPRTDIRTAECDWFGAERSASMARAALDGRLHAATQPLMPAEVSLFRINDWKFVGWPGEVFVEFGLTIKQADPNAFVITLANGNLYGYLVTADAIAHKRYEANNAVFQSPESPNKLVEATLRLLNTKPNTTAAAT